jgi:hypothetical protein
MTNTSNVVTASAEVDYDARDEFGTPLWISNTGPKKDSVIRSKRTGMRSMPRPGEISKEEARRLAAEAVKNFPITRID